jgi:hypothetical protein
MYPKSLVFGLLDTSDQIGDRALARKLRSLTLSWSRYDYHGRILEAPDVNRILDRALGLGYRWCYVQAYGNVIDENASPDQDPGGARFTRAIGRWLEAADFFVAGKVIANAAEGNALDAAQFMVDLNAYQALGRPPFHCGPDTSIPRSGTVSPGRRPILLLDAGVRSGKAVCDFPAEAQGATLYIDPSLPETVDGLRCYLNGAGGEAAPGRADRRPDLAARFFQRVRRQVARSRHGVFLVNLESYEDVQPPADFAPPVSTLYSVAAGFKPNAILQRLGFNDSTRVVFFDYSATALRVKQMLRDEWDGRDYPRLVQRLFEKFPPPQAHYYLGKDETPESVSDAYLQGLWHAETIKWGGETCFRRHWDRYRRLEHVYVECDILTEPSVLFRHVDGDPAGVIWWSNAFFTTFGNWHYTVEERQAMYRRWIEGVADRNPGLYLFGADVNNTAVNDVRAKPYAEQIAKANLGWLDPVAVNRCQIRF